MTDSRRQDRLVSLGEMCLHDVDECFVCQGLRLDRAYAVIALQSHILDVMSSERAYSQMDKEE